MLRHCLLGLTTVSLLSAGDLRALQRAPARCDQYQAALQADPNNLDAAARLGQCSVRDFEMIAPGGDSTRLMFRSSWTTALRALRHAVELDRGYSRAYQPLFSILFAETRDGCSSVTGVCGYVSPVLRAGDSVITIPRAVILNRPGVDTYDEVVRESRTKQRANLTEARTLAERWVAVAPQDRRPHEYLGQALLRLGDPAATVELENAARLGTPASRAALFWDRMEALIKNDRGEDARRLLDEAASDPARDTMRLSSYTLGNVNALLGRYPPPDTSANGRALRALQRTRIDSIVRSSPPTPPLFASFEHWLATGDTSRARRELARTDSSLTPSDGMRRFPRMDERSLASVEQHLALGDTVGAEARLAEIERPFQDGHLQYVGLSYRPGAWLGRAWLLMGDVAAARGRKEEAGRMYRRLIGLWGGGDADLKPVVDGARTRLASLSAR